MGPLPDVWVQPNQFLREQTTLCLLNFNVAHMHAQRAKPITFFPPFLVTFSPAQISTHTHMNTTVYLFIFLASCAWNRWPVSQACLRTPGLGQSNCLMGGGEAHKGRGQNTRKFNCVVLLCTQLLVSKGSFCTANLIKSSKKGGLPFTYSSIVCVRLQQHCWKMQFNQPAHKE